MSDDSPLKAWKSDPHYRLLQDEISSLQGRLDQKSELGRAIETLWPQHEPQEDPEGDEHKAFYRKVLAQMLLGKFERIVTPDAHTDTDALGAGLSQMNMLLDRKFAEVRALSEVAHDIHSGLFVRDVMNHIFDTFQAIVPFDYLGLALVEKNESGREWVRTHWSRAMDGEENLFASICRGVPLALEASGLAAMAGETSPQIDMVPTEASEGEDGGPVELTFTDAVRSSLTCPLHADGKLFGFIFFASRQEGAYTQDHAGIISAVSDTLGETLSKCRLYEDLTARNQFIRSVFGRYISDEIAEALLQHPDALKMGGRTCTVTVLMSDIRGFTKMSEHMSPEDVVSVLNNCFNEMVRVIHRHNGTIDNIIGDALMVLFGAPIARGDDPVRAVDCALDMQGAMAEVNRRNARMGLPPLSMGIGINTGDVVAGNIGSEAHAKYSVIGAPVNLAARLESKAGPGEVLVSASTFEQVRGMFEGGEVRMIEAKGFTGPVQAHVVTQKRNADGSSAL